MKDPEDLLVPNAKKVEKMYLSKDDQEAVESSSDNKSNESSSTKFPLEKKDTETENKLAKLVRYTSIIDFL